MTKLRGKSVEHHSPGRTPNEVPVRTQQVVAKNTASRDVPSARPVR